MVRMLFALSFALCTIPLGPVAAQFGSDLGAQHSIMVLDRSPHETQESLIWTGFYNGLVDGRVGRRTKKAIENFQTSVGSKPTGTLTDSEYVGLVERAARIKSGYGWTNFQHPTIGYEISYPANLLSESGALPNGGRRFASQEKRLELEIEILTAKQMDQLDRLYHNLSVSSSGREISYKRRKDNWFVVTGIFIDTSFYTRVEEHNGNLIGYNFRWPLENSSEFRRISIAIASSFHVPIGLKVPEVSEPKRDEIIQAETSDDTQDVSPRIGDLSVSSIEQRDSDLDPRDLFLLVKDAVWMLIAAPLKDGKPDLESAKQGSAVAVSTQHLLTNCHTLEASEVIIIFRLDGSEAVFPAWLVRDDKKTDRCVLAIKEAELTTAVPIRSSSELRIGERVYSVGAPSGLDLTIGEGLLSGKRSEGDILHLQNSAPISPGSSGGGLFDKRGNLIGITSFLLQDAQNLNFAISADEFYNLRQSE